MRGALLALLVMGLSLSSATTQERRTPPGEWCQRPAIPMPAKAHACSCDKANCADPDPNHVPAHMDRKCLNFCAVDNCSCVETDCP